MSTSERYAASGALHGYPCSALARYVAIAFMLMGSVGCTFLYPPSAATIRRIAVLPVNTPGTGGPNASGSVQASMGAAAIQSATNLQLVALGFEVVSPTTVASATNGRSPTSPQSAARLLADARVNAAAMYIELFTWEPVIEGDRAASITVGLDATLVDTPTGRVIWRMHHAAKPVPLYGVVSSSQADVFAADVVMREALASLAAKRSTTTRPVRRLWGGPHPR